MGFLILQHRCCIRNPDGTGSTLFFCSDAGAAKAFNVTYDSNLACSGSYSSAERVDGSVICSELPVDEMVEGQIVVTSQERCAASIDGLGIEPLQGVENTLPPYQEQDGTLEFYVAVGVLGAVILFVVIVVVSVAARARRTKKTFTELAVKEAASRHREAMNGTCKQILEASLASDAVGNLSAVSEHWRNSLCPKDDPDLEGVLCKLRRHLSW